MSSIFGLGNPYDAYDSLFRPPSPRTQRDLLRRLAEARIAVRWSRALFGGAVVFVVATACGWAFLVTWGMQGYGNGVDKGGAVFVMGLLLLFVTGGALAATGFSGLRLADSCKDLRNAEYAYEDSVLEAAA